jgi:hypothetical protein
MPKKQRKLKGIKRTNKKEKIKQLTSCHLKLLKNGPMRDGLKGVQYVHLKHHPIRMNTQSNLNTMDHYFVTTLNHHVELM